MTKVHDSDKDGSLLDDPFIFTEDLFIPKEPTTEEMELEYEHRAKTRMARQLGKVEAKKQSKAEKVDQKKLDNFQHNAGSNNSSYNPQKLYLDKKRLGQR